MTFAQDERAGLVAAMRAAGPDAPTLCAGWTNRDLAAHLIIRERRLDAAIGIMLTPLAAHTARVQAAVGSRGWGDLLDEVAAGPPWYSPFRPLDQWANIREMFIHHEDVLRGGADPAGSWMPRTLSPGLQDALVGEVRSLAKRLLGSLPARVSLRTPDGAELAAQGQGSPVIVTGEVGELVLFAAGRRPVAVSFDGDPDAITAVVGAVHGY